MTLNQCPYGKGAHILRAIEQRQTFFRSKFYRLPTHNLQYLLAAHHLALIFHLAEAYYRQREMRKWHEVARCAKRALHIHYWIDVIIEKVDKALHGVEFATRIAIAQRLNLEQKHYFHYFVRHSVACAASMRHHKVDLQLCQVVVTYRYIAKRPESGGYAIHGLSVCSYLLIEIFAAMHYALHCVFAKFQLIAFGYYFFYSIYCQVFG